MARFSSASLEIAHDIISRYPKIKSATIPLLHLAQEQDGMVTDDAMAHIAELVGITAAEVMGTCTFYEMFKLHEVGRHQINICHGISCHLLGADDLVHHAEESLGIKPGAITDDGLFSIEPVECIAACTEAPCLQVNYRYINKVTNDDFDLLIAGLRDGSMTVPPHGTLALSRQHIPADKAAGVASVETAVAPEWFPVEEASK